MPEEIVRVLFERGAFGAETTEIVARVLRYFAFGLPAFVLIKVFSPGFFAREDTKTPMYIAGVSMALNIALSLALFPEMAEAGIALATTVAGWVNALLLFGVLMRRGEWPMEAGTLRRSGLTLAVSLAMAAALAFGVGALDGALAPAAGVATQAAALLALVSGGALVYFALVQVTGAADLKGVARLMRRRSAGS
jgi:putative peptidoglycan lipid II flippase